MNNNTAEQKTALGTFLDKIRKKLQIPKIMSEPRTFEDVRSEYFDDMARSHFKIELSFDYLDEVERKINRWIYEIERYFSEFGGSWRYYALANRLDFLKEWSGDDDDYEDDGSIKTTGLTDEQLRCHTLINELYFSGSRDIVQDSIPTDVAFMISGILCEAGLDLQQIFSDIAHRKIDTYVMNEDGELEMETFEQHEMSKAMRGADAESYGEILQMLAYIMCDMCVRLSKVEETNPFDDNKKFYERFLQECYDVRDMRLEETEFWKREAVRAATD